MFVFRKVFDFHTSGPKIKCTIHWNGLPETFEMNWKRQKIVRKNEEVHQITTNQFIWNSFNLLLPKCSTFCQTFIIIPSNEHSPDANRKFPWKLQQKRKNNVNCMFQSNRTHVSCIEYIFYPGKQTNQYQIAQNSWLNVRCLSLVIGCVIFSLLHRIASLIIIRKNELW